jgi:hypothetical protein
MYQELYAQMRCHDLEPPSECLSVPMRITHIMVEKSQRLCGFFFNVLFTK